MAADQEGLVSEVGDQLALSSMLGAPAEGADARNGRATANVLLAGAMGCRVRDRTSYRSDGLPREICHQAGMLTGGPGRWDRMGRKWRCTGGAAAQDGKGCGFASWCNTSLLLRGKATDHIRAVGHAAGMTSGRRGSVA